MGFLNSANVQVRVIYALLMREIITRFGRHNIGFLWLFFEPMMFTIGVTILWTFTRANHGHSISIISFALTGYSSVLLWRNSVNRCVGAISPNQSLLFHHQVKVIDIYFARLLLEISGATMSFIFMSIIFIAVGFIDPPRDVLMMIYGWLLLAWFAVALGLTIGPLCEISEIFDRFWHPITYLLFPLSGTFFLVDWLPKSMQQILLYLPMVNTSEIIRAGYYGSLITPHYDFFYLIACNSALTLIGLILVKYITNKVEIL